MNARCRCESIEVLRLSGEVEVVPGLISDGCPVHFVRERMTCYGVVSALLPVGRHARCVGRHFVYRLRDRDGSVFCKWISSHYRRETSAEVQRRLYAEAVK